MTEKREDRLTEEKREEVEGSTEANARKTCAIQLENVVTDPQKPVPNIVNNGGNLSPLCRSVDAFKSIKRYAHLL